jgi:hypothetical protein
MRTLSPPTTAKLFATGFTIGPIVDSLHNQCLLQYDILPIQLEWPVFLNEWSNYYSYYFCSSWTVPPLLGIAYVILGGVLPRLFELLLSNEEVSLQSSKLILQQRAILAVGTTALIIKLSEFLETHPSVTDSLFSFDRSVAHLTVMLVASLSQWAILDGTIPALLVATLTSIGGPLSELPFVAHGVWEYLDAAADYVPLQNFPDNEVLQSILGEEYQNLALSSITGPCYFAVTMDAIALGRWFDANDELLNDELEQSWF